MTMTRDSFLASATNRRGKVFTIGGTSEDFRW